MTTAEPPAEDTPCAAPATKRVILERAQASFLGHGFHATRMDVIAREAGCSKKTIYKFFGSKEALFGELLHQLRQEMLDLSIDPTVGEAEALRRFLYDMSRIMLRDTSLALTRIVMSEAGNESVSQQGALDRSIRPRLALESYLNRLQQEGRYDFGVESDAARMLVGMALGAFHHETLLGLRAAIPEEELRHRISAAVSIFLRGARVDAGGA